MKKWFFCEYDKVFGPFSIKESNKLITEKPHLYAWHPSYSHWVPVSCIDEFELSITPPPPPSNIPTTELDDLINEEKQLFNTLDRIDKTIQITADHLYEINTDIDAYSETTQTLSNQVKTTIKSIAEQYTSLQKNLARVVSGVH
jgi:hypothetical protein